MSDAKGDLVRRLLAGHAATPHIKGEPTLYGDAATRIEADAAKLDDGRQIIRQLNFDIESLTAERDALRKLAAAERCVEAHFGNRIPGFTFEVKK